MAGWQNSQSFDRSLDKLEALYLYYHNTCGKRTWHSGYIHWGAPTHKGTRYLNLAVLWGHVTNFICTRSMSTKYGKLVTYSEGLPFINSYNPVNMWTYHVTWQIKNIIYPLSQRPWALSLLWWWHTLRSSLSYICMTTHLGGLLTI